MRTGILLVPLLLLAGCSFPRPPAPRTALEVREMQTRDFPVRNTRLVMKAVLNVLQDEGYVTKNAVTDLGLITATKETDAQDYGMQMVSTILGGHDGRWPVVRTVEANANVSEFGRDTRVRLSFQRKTLDNFGAVMGVQEISDPAFYQEFFAKVSKGIFIQQEGI